MHDKLHDKLHDKFPNIADSTWKVLDIIRENPNVTANELANCLGLKERMVRNHLSTLKNLGIIERIGSNKTGFWKLNVIHVEDADNSAIAKI